MDNTSAIPILADDVALRIDAERPCRHHIIPWKVDYRVRAPVEQKPMIVIRRVSKVPDDFARGIDVPGAGRDRTRWIDDLSYPIGYQIRVRLGRGLEGHA